jgi:uncharacterized protein YdaT
VKIIHQIIKNTLNKLGKTVEIADPLFKGGVEEEIAIATWLKRAREFYEDKE